MVGVPVWIIQQRQLKNGCDYLVVRFCLKPAQVICDLKAWATCRTFEEARSTLPANRALVYALPSDEAALEVWV